MAAVHCVRQPFLLFLFFKICGKSVLDNFADLRGGLVAAEILLSFLRQYRGYKKLCKKAVKKDSLCLYIAEISVR